MGFTPTIIGFYEIVHKCEGLGLLPLKKTIPVYLTEEERNGLRKASRFNAELMDYLRPHVKAGTTTDELDQLAYDYTISHGHTPACIGYHGYPKTICTSVNEVVCHGIPNNKPLKDGDIVNVDITTIVEGWYGDQSETFLIGEVAPAAKRLVQTTFDALFIGIRACSPAVRSSRSGKPFRPLLRPLATP